MAKEVIMPALGMAQETGTLIRWLKASGDRVLKGEPLMEIETDKATVEMEAPADGVLAGILAGPGDVVPVGQRIAWILAPGESPPAEAPRPTAPEQPPARPSPRTVPLAAASNARPAIVPITPLAARLAAEHNVDITRLKPGGGQIRKEDVLAFLNDERGMMNDEGAARASVHHSPFSTQHSRLPASPKARRLARERGLDLKSIPGSGPQGAVLAADVLAFQVTPETASDALPTSRVWRVMAERLSQAWTTIPHFYLIRDVNAARLRAWRKQLQADAAEKITITDLLIKLTALALRAHPRVNASWQPDRIRLNRQINIGLAVAVEDGLIVPVVQRADELELAALAARRVELVRRAQAGKLSLDDLSGGTFTISNLGMYGVDAFSAIVNPPQAAILAVSRIADRVVPVDGRPEVQPMVTLSLSCDHRVVDGARGAQFLQTLAEFMESPPPA